MARAPRWSDDEAMLRWLEDVESDTFEMPGPLDPEDEDWVMSPSGRAVTAWKFEGDLTPLLDVLRRGEASPDLQRWLADLIENNRLHGPAKVSRERGRASAVALEAIPAITRLLRMHPDAKGKSVVERAGELAALRHGLGPDGSQRLDNRKKRGRRSKRARS